mmetsp:Transcript_23154/g.53552  ORF Transcript_23154/g.53552 Transcript_23154/m.53552 type:complete len:326 (+) Transcript_23154:631-1608(+)
MHKPLHLMLRGARRPRHLLVRRLLENMEDDVELIVPRAELLIVVKREGDAVPAREERARAEARAGDQLEQLLEDAADRPDVDGCGVGLLQDDLWRAVPARHDVLGHLVLERRRCLRRRLALCDLGDALSCRLAGVVFRLVLRAGTRLPPPVAVTAHRHRACKAEVAELESALGRDEDVGGLEVAVDAGQRVHVGERGEHLRHVSNHQLLRHFLLAFDPPAQICLHEVRHHKHVLKGLDRRWVDERSERDNVRMAKVTEQANLAQHLFCFMSIIEDFGNSLDCDHLARVRVLGGSNDRIGALARDHQIGVPLCSSLVRALPEGGDV